MSDRRNKERERVWGRRPVILRFDPGHTRPIQQSSNNSTLGESAASLLASLFQTVIQTDNISDQNTVAEKQTPQWYLVESDESSTIRKPIELETAVESQELEAEDARVLTQTQSKARQKSFWRLQSPHISLNVFPPKR